MKQIKVTWAQVDKYVRYIEQQIRSSDYKIKAIYGVPRGGLIIAIMLSHRLDLPMTEVIKSTTLVVDDISDTGETFKVLEKKEKKVLMSASLVTKIKSGYWPDFTGYLLPTKEWVIFPWETKETSKKDNTRV